MQLKVIDLSGAAVANSTVSVFPEEDVAALGAFMLLGAYVTGDPVAKGVASGVILGQGFDENDCHVAMEQLATGQLSGLSICERLGPLGLMAGHSIGPSFIARPMRRFLLDTLYFRTRAFWSVGQITDLGVCLDTVISWGGGEPVYEKSEIFNTARTLKSVLHVAAGRQCWLEVTPCGLG